MIRRGWQACIIDGGWCKFASVSGVSLAIGGGYLGVVGLKAVRDVGSDHKAGGGDGGVRDDDFVELCAERVVQYPPHAGVLTAI